MKDSKTKGKAIGDVACLRDDPHFCVGEPEPNGKGPKGNPSSAGQNASKSKKDGNRRKRNKGRS